MSDWSFPELDASKAAPAKPRSKWDTPSKPPLGPARTSSHSSQQQQQSHPKQPPAATGPLQVGKLWVDGITAEVGDRELVDSCFTEVLKVRVQLSRPNSSRYALATGFIEFESLDKAEKAYATLQGVQLPNRSCSLRLFVNESLKDEPVATATPRFVKGLPLDMTSGQLFDLFRPLGPVYRAVLQRTKVSPWDSQEGTVLKGNAVVTFFNEADAVRAAEELHMSEVTGQTITIQLFDNARTAGGAAGRGGKGPNRGLSSSRFATAPDSQGPMSTPTRTVSYGSQRASPAEASVGNSPAVAAAAKKGLDASNLFVKSLDPSITSEELHGFFSSFGEITSAHVMRHESTGVSKEFGFVAFTTPEAATKALQDMNGTILCGRDNATGIGKRVTVRIHEPKAIREAGLRRSMAGDVAGNGSPSGELEPTLMSRMGNLSTSSSDIHSPTSAERSLDAGNASIHSTKSYATSPTPSLSASLTSPLTTPGLSSPGSQLSDKERLVLAVQALKVADTDAIVELLDGLGKKDKKLCLFNSEFLKLKVADAQEVLLAMAEDDEPIAAAPPASTPSTPAPKATTPQPPATAGPPASSLEELAARPAVQVLADINSASPATLAALGLTKATPEQVQEIDAFVAGLEGKPTHEKKQKLGDRLFKAIKAFGIKGAPKITIQLLDSEDFSSLAHLLHYEPVLKAKATSFVKA